MDAFFEKHFKFNPANVDRFTFSEVDALQYYSAKRLTNQRIVFGFTLLSMGLALLIFGMAIVARLLQFVFPLSLVVLMISGVLYRVIRGYYWHNFSLKTIQYPTNHRDNQIQA